MGTAARPDGAASGAGVGQSTVIGVARRHPTLVLLLAALALLLGAALRTAPAHAAPVRTQGPPIVTTLASGLEVPWDIAFLPDGRALVSERPGRVRIVSPDGRVAPQPAATIAVTQNGESGLLGVAVDPGFSAAAPFVYLSLDTAARCRCSGGGSPGTG